MPLDPVAQAVCERLRELGNPTVEQIGVQRARDGLRNWNLLAPAGPEVASVEDVAEPVPMRVYRPVSEVRPIVVWLHGGGWTLGSIEEHDAFCRHLACATDCTVVSVGYRLSPEHPFPAGLDDCWTALCWAATQPGGDRLAVAGDSAGGNLAAALTLRARDAGGPPLRFQLLVYPAVDHTLSFPSIVENGRGFFLYEDDIRWFRDHLLRGHDPRDPLASPYFATDLSGLPPAYVVTAEYDPLRDEGEAYAERLRDAGVLVTLRRWDGQLHAFFTMVRFYPAAEPALLEAAAALRSAMAD
ncbi:MAG TPA: alpha/beta hydrolase [Acidimicrobiales bacterium]|nr:alpha/beta hydrolase [Acidimicrobiales bacterium]